MKQECLYFQGSQKKYEKTHLWTHGSSVSGQKDPERNMLQASSEGKGHGLLTEQVLLHTLYKKTSTTIGNLKKSSIEPGILDPPKLAFRWEDKARTQKVNHPQTLPERIIPEEQ